ncbi:MAG: integrating conjugative element protein, partial [Gammaproteobacteria bacterium]|nr:integrating conjugative element protein [Gammaproteobacteria bacterium]
MAPTEDGFWYYEIGGARPVSPAANPSVVSVTLGGSAQLGLGYSCGKFDPVSAVEHTLNEIGAGIDSMMNAMTAAATAALAALPALILQRANPGLYDLFQNALIRAEETLRLATKSCEQMEA